MREWYENQAHCVSTTWMFCCVTEKSLLTSSLLVTIVIMMLFVWTRPLWGRQWSSQSSQMILVESNQSVKDLWYVFILREICAEPKRVSEEESSYELCWVFFFKTNDSKLFLNFSPDIIEPSGCNDTQTAEQEIWSKERWDSNEINCNIWNVFCIISNSGLAFYLLYLFVLIHIHVVLHLSCLSNKKLPVMKERLNLY